MWRALAVYRVLVLGYAVIVVSGRWTEYERPTAGWVVVAGMALWTLFCAWAYASPGRRRWPLLAADLAVGVAAILVTALVDTAEHVREGAPTIPTFWVSAAALAWSLRHGAAGGATAATVLGLANLVERGGTGSATLANIFLLFLAGTVVGYVSRLALAAEAERARAAELAAATAERERLARTIHDGVLQVLGLVQRRGAEIGGDAAELGRLAGEQEAALRSLVAAGRVPPAAGDCATDLHVLLSQAVAERPQVTLSAPAGPVELPGEAARELVAATAAALDNVAKHVGERAPAWVLLEDEGETIVVTVRDAGPGIPAGRLDEARAEGRLGLASSILGRLMDLGGTARVTSVVGEGTEVELRLPVRRA
jgi:signal transduction histidine kinase